MEAGTLASVHSTLGAVRGALRIETLFTPILPRYDSKQKHQTRLATKSVTVFFAKRVSVSHSILHLTTRTTASATRTNVWTGRSVIILMYALLDIYQHHIRSSVLFVPTFTLAFHASINLRPVVSQVINEENVICLRKEDNKSNSVHAQIQPGQRPVRCSSVETPITC